MLDRIEENHIENILALRGDIPQDMDFPSPQHYRYACELIQDIRSQKGDRFCIGGACYPEGGSQMLFTGPRYAELEFSSGLRHLKPGEIFENSVQWELVRLPRNTGNGDAARTAQDTATKLLQGNRDHE